MLVRRIVIPIPLVMRAGLLLFVLGAAGDVAYHALPLDVAHQLDPVLGADAYRTHLATLLGMLALVAGLLWKGVSHVGQRQL
jgi:hypothetical protein